MIYFLFCAFGDVRRWSLNNYCNRSDPAVIQDFVELCFDSENWPIHIKTFVRTISLWFFSCCVYKLFSILSVAYCNSSVIFIRLFSGQNVVSVTWETWQWMILPLKIVPLCLSQTNLAHQRNSCVPTSTASQRIICVIL